MPLCCIMRPSTGCRRCPNPELIWRFATGQIKRTGALSSSTAAALDGMEVPYPVGSLAGDDTVLLVLRDNAAAAEFADEIKEMLR